MKYEIKNRYSGAVLFAVEAESFKLAVELAVKAKIDLIGSDLRGRDLRGSNLSGSDLRYSNLSYSNLRGSDLSYSDLSGSDLIGSDLRYSNLSYSNLRGSDLRYSNLRYSKGINKYRTSPIYILLDQVGPIRAYKLITSDYRSPIHTSNALTYEVGETVETESYNVDEHEQCGEGLHVATLDWCLREVQEGWKILLVEFDREDLVCIPLGTDGKFRVKKLRVVRELNLQDYLDQQELSDE